MFQWKEGHSNTGGEKKAPHTSAKKKTVRAQYQKRGKKLQKRRVMELYHSVMTPAQVESARVIFESFADTVVSNPGKPTHMGILAVLKYLGTIGIKLTENEAKDLVMTLTQSSSLPEETKGNPPIAAPQPSAASPNRRTSSPTAAVNKKRRSSSKSSTPMRAQMTPVQPPLDPTSSSVLALSFENFISLSLQTFNRSSGGDCDFHSEAKATFNLIDKDKDGQLSLQDLRETLRKHFEEPYTSAESKRKKYNPNPHSDFSKLTDAQLLAMLRELDVGSDGVVSLDDFCSAIITS